MTEQPMTVTDDLHSALELLHNIQANDLHNVGVNNLVVPIDIGPAITAVEKAISKIQNLRCEALANLDKL